MNKRVHEIAKERGMAPKELLQRLQGAGIEVKAVSSSVDEAVASRVLGNGDGAAGPAPDPASAAQAPAAEAPAAAQAPARDQAPPEQRPAREQPPAAARGQQPGGDGAPAPAAPTGSAQQHKRPTRDSLQGERAPGAPGGRRRVVIDSQASRRAPGGGAPPSTQPPRRQRRGRRRRGVYDEEAESRPSTSAAALAEPSAIRINSGSTVKDVAEYLGVQVPEVMKKLMALGEMKTLTQTLSDDSIQLLAAELNKDVEIVHSEDEAVAEPVFDDADEDLVERAPV